MAGTDSGRDFLIERVDSSPGCIALVDASDGPTWTYRELDGAVDAVAHRLRDVVDSPEEPTVAIMLSPRPAVPITFYAAMRLGWRTAALNPELDVETLARQYDLVKPDLLVNEPATGESGRQVADCPVWSVEDGVFDAAGAADADRSVAPASIPASATVLVLFTSGTTGEPQGVRLTQGNLAASAHTSALRLGVTPEDCWLGCLPVYHMGGFAPVVRAVIYGSPLVLQRGFDAADTLANIEDRRVTHVSLVPTQLRRLLETAEDTTPFESLRAILLGGAPADESLLERALSRDIPVHPTYGLTETASQVATALPAEVRDHPGTVGYPLYGTDVTLVADGEAVGPGERGEIVVDGPTVTPGYLSASATREAFGEDGFHTGDLGYRDADGRLWVLGRLDEMILTGGELVAPATVAEALESHDGVRTAAVIGLPDDEWGERVAALVVGDDGADDSLSPTHLREYCRTNLAPYEVPKTITLAESLPRTASGTVDRAAVREKLSAADGASEPL